MAKILKTKPQLVMKDGKPNAIIIDLKDYRELLERLEDKEDIVDLEKMRHAGLNVRKFSDFFLERNFGKRTERRLFFNGIVKGLADIKEGREISLSGVKKRLKLSK